MSGQIKINSLEYMSAAAAVRNAAAGVDAKLDTWTSQGEQSIALEAYAQQFLELEKTLKLFQTLVHADSEIMTDIGREFFLADLKLTALWK